MVPANVSAKQPIVTVHRTEIQPDDKPQALKHPVQVCVYGAGQTGEITENTLDELIDGVFLSIERLAGYRITSAKRGTLHDVFAGWVVDVEATSNNVYREIIMKENRNHG